MIKLQISKFIILLALFFFSIFNIFSYSESIDKQVSDISNELLCPVCRGQTGAESNSDLANDFRDIIKTKLKEGQTKEEILNYFTSRYGDSVLSSPSGERLQTYYLDFTCCSITIWFDLFNQIPKNKK